MNRSLKLYRLFLVIKIITTALGKNIKIQDSPVKNIYHINKPSLNHTCCGRTIINSRIHKNEIHPTEIPLSTIMELNQITNISELLRKFTPHINNYEFLMHTTINNFQGSAIVPKAATCTTEMHTVSLRDDDNPNLYYSPTCTRVKRCGGCCGSNLVSCQPIQVEMLDFEVTILQYNGTFTIKEKKIITVEQHVKCKCDCIIKEKDCKPSQVYNTSECRCICNNVEDQDKCDAEYQTKMWDSETCSCRCIEEQECTTGYKFNHNTCRCEL